MNRKILIFISIVLVMISLIISSGCTQNADKIYPPNTNVNPIPTQTAHAYLAWSEQGDTNHYGYYEILKIEIPEDKTVCYIFDNYNGGGISCMKKDI